MFETGYSLGRDGTAAERQFVELTRDINGWHTRGILHGPVADNSYVEDLFENVDKIDLLKIDVDDRASYEAVFAGVRAVLHKTEIVQVEMIEAEIGRSGMLWIMGIMQSHNFLMLGLEDVETFPGFRHGSLGHDCVNSTLPIRMHSEAVETGRVPYEYGKDGPGKIRMFPICECGTGVMGQGLASQDPFNCNIQFAFVRRDATARSKVTELYGSCETLCAERTEL